MNETYIKEFIIDGDFISQNEIPKVENKMFEDGLSFVEAIIELNLLEPEIINKIISLTEGVPTIKLKNKAIPLDVLILIPEPIARTKKIIPFSQENSEVSIAIPNTDISYEFIRKIIPNEYAINIYIADEDDINRKISDYQKMLKSELLSGMLNNLKNISKVEDFGFKSEKDLPENFHSDIANNYYSEKFIRELMEYAHTSNASHIYINNGEDKHLISFRIFGENYPVIEIEKDTVFSISSKLKTLADINIFDREELIKDASFKAELNKEIINIFLSFTRTFFGESITIELGKNQEFGTEFITSVAKQKELLYKNLNDHKGFYIITGESKSGKTKSTYSLMEYETKKNKEIYSLEDLILHRINFVNQILIDKKTKKEILLSKIIQNSPDMISIDYIKPFILKTLFNYVSFGGKVILGIKNDIDIFLETLLNFDFDKGEIVRNFNILINHKKFKKLDINSSKKIFINKNQVDILKIYISKEEILDLFKNEKLISEKETKIEKIPFYTSNKKNKKNDFLYIRGVHDLGLMLENSFLKRTNTEKIKINGKQLSKKSILENALILSHRGKIDFQDILVFLTKG